MALCLTPWLYSNHNEFWGDFPIDVRWSYNTSPSTAAVAHSSSSKSNSQCHTQFHSLTDPFFLPPVQERVHRTQRRIHTNKKKKRGDSADCLLSTRERLATWLLLTFNRVHYGGAAPVHLLLNTKDMEQSSALTGLKPFPLCWVVTGLKTLSNKQAATCHFCFLPAAVIV